MKEEMKVYAIKTPPNTFGSIDSVIWWFAMNETDAWSNFFGDNTHRMPIEEARRAYTAIGYKCVRVRIEEVKK